ncbi:type I restriction-modification system subunit M [Anaerotignum propionicum]|uniref:type I restriction-modification system subunit M n=1 Tax=Anaerotignum propionicum TaxID=28446 RepID=UPI00210B4E9D|nr:type I restriction-modification system subunit M [Anaerotignum propionicum]MCQ4936330.1 type I restriction-modification system subunit M [Anaerotignum propionicum]
MNKQQLASKIWEQANAMRSKIEANDYKDYILGFIFYKYLSDKELKFLKENDFTENDIKNLVEDDEETVKFIQDGIGYFISYKDLFSSWISMGKDFDISNVRDALSAFSRLINKTHKKVFDGVFYTLQTGLSKLGESAAAQTKSVSELIQLIKDIPMDGKQDYDVLGFIYEYLISMFAANAGKKAGEFYTPHEVAVLMAEIVAENLKDKNEIKIYDPTSGSGSLLINIGKAVAKHIESKDNIQYYAQELKQNTYNLTRMNLVMRGIIPDNIITRNGDTLEEDWPFFDENDPINSYDPLYVDAVVSNPPYSQKWDPANKETDPRYARFGLAPKTKADFAFLLHDLYHVKPHGIMTIVLPHGVLFRGGEEGEIRKNLIENNHIDAIIGLPANIFFGTGIPTIIMVLKQERDSSDVLIIDASKGFVKEGKNNKLRASDIKKIADAVSKRKSISKYAALVSRDTIRKNEYNLNIPRYVDSFDEGETWDIYASMFGGIPMAEIESLQEYWEAFPTLKESIFTKSDTPYVDISCEDVKTAITSHADVLALKQNFNTAFESLAPFLKAELIEKMESLAVSKQEAVLSDDIFKRVKTLPLIDKYKAYQLLDDEWVKIAVDLEIIQTEGFAVTKQVDPNMVIKKKDGKDTEVQDGFVGHVIPFELVQGTLLKEETDKLKAEENRLSEILSEYEESIDSLSEEEKEGDFLNDATTAFVAKGVTAKLKELRSDGITEETKALFETLTKVDKLLKEEKELKAAVKKDAAALHILTKETIETLTDEQVLWLLEQKWIVPLVDSLYAMPNTVFNELVGKIQALADKYETTYEAVQTQIKQTEEALCDLIDQLEGNEFDMKGLSEFKSLLMGEE